MARALQFLRQNRRHDALWQYQPFLPPDLDDTTAALSAFPAEQEQFSAERMRTIEAVLNFQSADGGLQTWLIAPDELRKYGYSGEKFPVAEIHSEVMAYFFAALSPTERKRYSVQVGRAANYLLARQKANGSWSTVWYRSDLYATFRVYSFLFSVCGKDSKCQAALARAERFVLGRQKEDGSWGEKDASVLDTAFALLVLCQSHPCTESRLARAWDFLYSKQRPDGAWPAEPFFFLDLSQREQTQAPRFIGSELYSTSIVIAALLAARS
ncbi:MAG: hypothetical protein OHK0011_23280 [Turneriella sp.]